MQEGGEYFESEVLLVAQTVGAALDDSDLVVDALDQTQGDFVLGETVGLDAIPVTLDHCRKSLKGREALPAELVFPSLEESSGPARSAKAPELAEGFLQEIGSVESLVDLQQESKALAAAESQMLRCGQKRELLALDEAAVSLGGTPVFILSDSVQRLAQVTHHVELVVNDHGLRGMAPQAVLEGFPHVHYSHLDPGRAPLCMPGQPREELCEALLGAVLSPEPDGPSALQVADHDSVLMALLDGDLVRPDHARRFNRRGVQKTIHVGHLDPLDLVPAQVQQIGHRGDRRVSKPVTDLVFEASSELRRRCKPFQLFPFHAPAPRTPHSSQLETE